MLAWTISRLVRVATVIRQCTLGPFDTCSSADASSTASACSRSNTLLSSTSAGLAVSSSGIRALISGSSCGGALIRTLLSDPFDDDAVTIPASTACGVAGFGIPTGSR